MNPVKRRQLFRQVGDFEEDPEKTDEQLLAEANRKAFMPYQVGCWVTAWARYELERGIRMAHQPDKGVYFVYADTDSVKYIGDIDWTEYNNERKAECLTSGSWAADPDGKIHYMGVYETEDDPETGYCYYQFKTLGAKKYAFIKKPGGKTEVTIAGVNKKKGGEELDQHGGLVAFQEGFIFRDAGGTMSVYNDQPEIETIHVDGHDLRITSNVAILPSTYRLGITGEYERIIKFWHSYLDNPYIV